jgi:choline-sulfatase
MREVVVPRRKFLKGAAAGIAALALEQPALFAMGKAQKKPNILLLMSDEHNHEITGCYGNKVVRTPNIDGLAAAGVTFDTHYCNSPLCSPSRSSFTAGKYISRVSAWNNECELPSADIASLPRVMNAAGYESFLCGKQHYDYSRRYGFTEVGGNFNNNYKTGRGNRARPEKLTEKEISPRFAEFHPGDHGSTVEHDRRVTAAAVDFLQKRAKSKVEEKPFFLFTGYLAPHFPLIVPEEFYDRYKGKVGMPTPLPAGFLESAPLNYRVMRAAFEEMDVPAETVLRGRELYYGLTEWVDNEMGKVLAALRANKALAENTVVIYASDHGENMGEHGMWWKNAMYEQSARVPLVISWPERWKGGQRRVGASSHVDLVQTIAEIGGATCPADWNGTSMVAWMDNPKHAWKDFAVSQYYAQKTASGYVMVRSGDWKYVYHATIDSTHPAERQLVNVAADPHEFTNLAGRPEHAERVAAMHAFMLKEVGEDPDAIEQRARAEMAQGYHRTDKKPKGGAPEEA